MLSGLGDHVARRIPTDGMNAEDRKRLRNAYQVCHASHIHLCRLTLGVAMLKAISIWESLEVPIYAISDTAAIPYTT